MLKLLKKLLGRSKAPAITPRVVTPSVSRPSAEPSQPIPQVEVAHLSLAAIIRKLPDELRKTVTRIPDDSATVALPLAIIQKQLPTGSVKMSLASLYRQAPAGTFAQARTEDRRMVEIPLSEVFRHVNPQLLPRKEQRRAEIPQDAVGLFGDSSNPYAVAPGVPDAPARALGRSEPQRILQPPAEMHDNGASDNGSVTPPPALQNAPRSPAQPKAASRSIAPPSGFVAPRAVEPAPDSTSDSSLILPLQTLAAAWPEPIRSEALGLEGVTVALPTGAVTAALAKGKVTFTWGQIRSWLNPAPTVATEGKEATELLLPLKVVAPAFLSQSKPKAGRRSIEIDGTIPALFSGGTAEAPPASEPSKEGAAPAPPAPASQQAAAPLPPPVVLAPPPEFAAPTPTEPIPAPQAEPPSPTVVRPAAAAIPPPGTRVSGAVGEVLGVADKPHWTPPDLVKAAVRLPGVAGAVVALQEGLLVAAELPEHMRGDTVAAFLPQIFARLNNYAGEMKLGSVEDVLFTTNGAHFQIYRLGEIYFAVLGHPGETLPWDSLRRIVEELAHHHQK